VNLNTIRGAIIDVLAPLSIRAYSFVPETINPPCVYVAPRPPFEFVDNYDGGATIQILMRIYAASTNSQAGQQLLDDLLSTDDGDPNSAVAALMANPTLNGIVSSLKVSHPLNYGRIPIDNGSLFWAAEVELEILT
jgi:hypothetical protein